MKLGLAKLLSFITGLLVVVLVAVFANFATTAFERQRDAAHIRAIVAVKRALVQAQEAVRVEGAILDSALEEKDAADAQTLRLHFVLPCPLATGHGAPAGSLQNGARWRIMARYSRAAPNSIA